MKLLSQLCLGEARLLRDHIASDLLWQIEFSDEGDAARLIEEICCQGEGARGALHRLRDHLETQEQVARLGKLWLASMRVAQMEVAAIPEPRSTVPYLLIARLNQMNAEISGCVAIPKVSTGLEILACNS
jgi:hypothetical protein